MTDICFCLAVGSMHTGGRELLEDRGNPKANEEHHEKSFLLTPKGIAVALSGAFAAFCLFICPCFFWRKKPTDHTVLPKDPNSSTSLNFVGKIIMNDEIPIC